MKRKGLSIPLLLLLSHLCLLVAVLFLVTAGCRIYRQVTVQRAENESLRTTLSYLQNQIAANDTAGGVRIGKGPEGDLLALSEPGTGCEVYVYAWQGSLVEELALAGERPRPAMSEEIAAVESFAVTKSGQTLELEVNGKRAWMSLRCEGER